MTATRIDGHAAAADLCDATRLRAEEFAARTGRRPSLVAIQVGESASSKVYTDSQARAAGEVGMDYQLRNLPETASEADIRAELQAIGRDDTIDGVIVQMPLPAGIDTHAVQQAIPPRKDAEGVHPQNLGWLFYRDAKSAAPCTPMAVVKLLRYIDVPLAGKEAVVIGHSEIVGKPIAMLLLVSAREAPTVRVCHVATRDLESHVRAAEILIVAAGASGAKYAAWKRGDKQAPTPDLRPLIPGEWIREGAVVLDVAINRIPAVLDDEGRAVLDEDGKPAVGENGKRMVTVGDVEFDTAAERAAAITPVPGGGGPVTVQMLFRNTIFCAEEREENS